MGKEREDLLNGLWRNIWRRVAKRKERRSIFVGLTFCSRIHEVLGKLGGMHEFAN